MLQFCRDFGLQDAHPTSRQKGQVQMGLRSYFRRRRFTKRFGENKFSVATFRRRDGKVLPVWFVDTDYKLNLYGSVATHDDTCVSLIETFIEEAERERAPERVLELSVSPEAANWLFRRGELTLDHLRAAEIHGGSMRLPKFVRIKRIGRDAAVGYADLVITTRFRGGYYRYDIAGENMRQQGHLQALRPA